jgi:hypothetical protein
MMQCLFFGDRGDSFGFVDARAASSSTIVSAAEAWSKSVVTTTQTRVRQKARSDIGRHDKLRPHRRRASKTLTQIDHPGLSIPDVHHVLAASLLLNLRVRDAELPKSL